MKLPIECIHLILDHLDESTRVRDLNALLRVNKSLFQAVVRRLYSDPISVIKSCENRHQAALKFLALVLRYSPAQDEDVQLLRSCLPTELSIIPERPIVDYLSLIKTIRSDFGLFGSASPLAMSLWGSNSSNNSGRNSNNNNNNNNNNSKIRSSRQRDTKLYDVMLWAACGHRLYDMQNIEIYWHDLERYDHCIDDMALMRSIHLRAFGIPIDKVSSWASGTEEWLLGALQDIFHFASRWSEAYSKLGDKRSHVEMELKCPRGAAGWWKRDPFTHQLKEIFSLMPISTTRKFSTQDPLDWARLALAPKTVDLSRIKLIEAYAFEGEWSLPEQHILKILQECRSLTTFRLHYTLEIQGDIFEWAAQERRNAALSSSKCDSRVHCSLIPLSELYLVLSFRVDWQHVIYAFGATLKTVIIEDSDSHNQVDLCLFHDMPELQDLHIAILSIGNSKCAPAFSKCPKLTAINLESEDTGHVERFNPWDLPLVKTLYLRGPICRAFNQATLETMSQLVHLKLVDYPTSLLELNRPPLFVWDTRSWECLPRLQSLCLQGEVAHAFRWEMIEECPNLQELELKSRCVGEERPVLDVGNSTRPLKAHLAVVKFTLVDFKIGYDILSNQLPKRLPRLISFSLIGCIHLDNYQKSALMDQFPLLSSLRYY